LPSSPKRLIAALILLVAFGGLLAGCSHRPAFVSGEVTSVSDRGDRVCVDTIANDKTHIVCGKRPADDQLKLKTGDCYKARWGYRNDGRFTDVQHAATCEGTPVTSK
jgi:hypothetical protein